MLHSPIPGDGCPQIAESYRAQGMEAETLKAMQRCYDFEPSNADSIFFYAHELERQGQPAKARALYEKGHALSPNYPDIAVGLARTQSVAGDNRSAHTLILEVLKRRPDNVDALLAAGLIASRMGDYPSARRYLEHGRTLQPDYKELETVLAHVNSHARRARAAR
jgi:tetratricopeptide (TPR) repeat protein